MTNTLFLIWMQLLQVEMLVDQFFEKELDCSPVGLPYGDGTSGGDTPEGLEADAVDAYFENYESE